METSAFEAMRDAIVGRLSRSVRHSVTTILATPEENLDYKPTETARSVREIAQHMIEGNNYCLQAFKLDLQGDDTVVSQADLVAELEKTGNALAEFAGKCGEAEFVAKIEFFGQSLSIVQMALTTEWHLTRHCGQIDYLQTTWNDLENHF